MSLNSVTVSCSLAVRMPTNPIARIALSGAPHPALLAIPADAFFGSMHSAEHSGAEARRDIWVKVAGFSN
jgi:hypothetical protein